MLLHPTLRRGRKMEQCVLLQQALLTRFPSSLSFSFSPPSLISTPKQLRISASIDDRAEGGSLSPTAKERRRLKNERRERKAGYSWREEIEERLMKKPKKKYVSWTEELNLDNLALLGPQWWAVRFSRVSGQTAAETLAKLLARRFPDMEFKIYIPSVRVKRKLKNGTLSERIKPLYRGSIFLWCVLNKEVHDFVRDCDGIGGFLGSRVGSTIRQINRAKPISAEDMEEIFREAKEEQEKFDRAFEEEQKAEGIHNVEEQTINTDLDNQAIKKFTADSKPKRQSKKDLQPFEENMPSTMDGYKFLAPGSTVRVTSGPFQEFEGCVKELDHENRKARVGFMLFGKESLVDLDIERIVPQST